MVKEGDKGSKEVGEGRNEGRKEGSGEKGKERKKEGRPYRKE